MQPAGFLKRVLALVYDSLLIGAIVLVLSLLLVFINGGYPESGSFVSFMQFFILVFAGPIFYSYFWIKNNGQTLGMQSWRIRLVSSKNLPLTLKITLTRCVVSFLSALFFELGYFWILFNKDNLSWSDLVTDTKIIKVNNK